MYRRRLTLELEVGFEPAEKTAEVVVAVGVGKVVCEARKKRPGVYGTARRVTEPQAQTTGLCLEDTACAFKDLQHEGGPFLSHTHPPPLTHLRIFGYRSTRNVVVIRVMFQ
jgi:hypothetical protein